MHVQRLSRLLVLIGCVVLSGCAAGGNSTPAGKWDTDMGVQQLFVSGAVFPNHTYYYLGSIGAPDSIIAIDNRFTLRSRVWAQIEMTEQLLNEWLQWYRTEQYGAGCEYRGGVILTPDGERAGVWYSQNIVNIIRMPEPGVLEVYQPRTPSGATCGRDRDSALPGGLF